MNARAVMTWAPRVLGIAFAAFLAIFALDVFGEARGAWATIVALAIHLMPTWIVLAVVALAWRREWIGAVAFPLLAVAYVAFAWGRFDWRAYAAIAGPLVLIGLLFGLGARSRAGAALGR